MKKFILMWAIAALCTVSAVAPSGWETKIESAFAKARKRSKPVLLVIVDKGTEKKLNPLAADKDFAGFAKKYAVCLYLNADDEKDSARKEQIQNLQQQIFAKAGKAPHYAVVDGDMNVLVSKKECKMSGIGFIHAISQGITNLGGSEPAEVSKLDAKYQKQDEEKKKAAEKKKKKEKKEKKKKDKKSKNKKDKALN